MSIIDLSTGDQPMSSSDGQVTIALWDKRIKTLFLARDRVGKKPLYYYQDGKTLVFASELKAVLKVPGISRQMDYQGLDAYFSFGYVPSPMSIFKHVRKIRPEILIQAVMNMKKKEILFWKIFLHPHLPIILKALKNRGMITNQEELNLMMKFLIEGFDLSNFSCA